MINLKCENASHQNQYLARENFGSLKTPTPKHCTSFPNFGWLILFNFVYCLCNKTVIKTIINNAASYVSLTEENFDKNSVSAFL